MKWKVLCKGVSILLFLGCCIEHASAHETDQFSVPVGRPMADLRLYFSTRVHQALTRAVSDTNARIKRSLRDGQPSSETERLYSPDTLAWAVLYEFPPVINYVERMEWTLRSSEVRDQYPGRLTVYQPTFWIYSHWALMLDPTKLIRLARCSTVMVDGVYFGTDKIAHFVHMGYLYFTSFRSALAAGKDDAEATRSAIELGTGGNLFLSENTLLGMLATGVRSNADLASNYLGFKFFRNLTEPVRLRGVMRPPLLVRDGHYWRLADHVNPHSDFFAVFVSDHWNEALNPSMFGLGIAECVREEVQSRCKDLLAFYVDGRGHRRGPVQFSALAERLQTYFGEEYGFQSDPSAMVAIADVCFEEAASDSVPDANLAAAKSSPPRTDERPTPENAKDGDEFGRTSLWWAAAEGRLHEVRDLLGRHADVNQVDIDGETPLHAACRRGHTEVAATLLDRGAKANAVAAFGTTPLIAAVRGLHVDTAKVLLAHSANVWQRDVFGCCPLHEASALGDGRLTRILLSKGADVHISDESGTTPLHRAARAGKVDTVALLLAAGADARAVNAYGRTPVDEAKLGRHTDVLKLFKGAGRQRTQRSTLP